MSKLFQAKPYIVAEVGSNWTTREQAVESVGRAASVGADAVKFQAFSHQALYGWETPGGNDLRHALPLAWLAPLKEKADACGIDFLCTAFSPDLVQAVDPFVSAHKIASSDCSWPQLLEAVARTGKPILLSTGAHSKGDIWGALETINRISPTTSVVLLYCVASYPAKTVNMLLLSAMQQEFKRAVGYSDHTMDVVWTPFSAVLAGACVIEKHFTAFEDLDTPDRPHSLGPDDFKTMVDHLKGRVKVMLGPSPEEKPMLLRHNRRLITTKIVSVGEKLRYGVNYGAYRSQVDDDRGLMPMAWKAVEGKSAMKSFARGEAIGPWDFE